VEFFLEHLGGLLLANFFLFGVRRLGRLDGLFHVKSLLGSWLLLMRDGGFHRYLGVGWLLVIVLPSFDHVSFLRLLVLLLMHLLFYMLNRGVVVLRLLIDHRGGFFDDGLLGGVGEVEGFLGYVHLLVRGGRGLLGVFVRCVVVLHQVLKLVGELTGLVHDFGFFGRLVLLLGGLLVHYFDWMVLEIVLFEFLQAFLG
jgi:hypothetical protein